MWLAFALATGYVVHMPESKPRLSDLVLARQLLASGEGRRIREAAGISERQLAAQVGVTVGALSRWETRGRRPRVAHALKYLEAVADLLAVLPTGSAGIRAEGGDGGGA